MVKAVKPRRSAARTAKLSKRNSSHPVSKGSGAVKRVVKKATKKA